MGPNPLWILGMQMILAQDARYFLDFWREEGYAGKAATPQVLAMTLELTAEVEAVLTGDEVAALLADDQTSELTGAMRTAFKGDRPAAIRLKGDAETGRMLGASLVFETGPAKGRRLLCTGSAGGALTASLDPASFAEVRPGDRLAISNKALVAFMFYHRHFVDARYPGMAEFLDGGRPRFVQRPVRFDALETPSGAFQGKMILLQHRLDREALPTCAEPFVRSVRRHLGDSADQAFRIWWLDNAQHGAPQTARTRYIDFRGCFSQALADVVAWVEGDKAPPASSVYEFDALNQLVLPARAADRRGIQPTIALTVNGKPSARVEPGATVRFDIRVEAPPDAGRIVAVALDLDGSGDFAAPCPVPSNGRATQTFTISHAFALSGRYVVAAKAQLARRNSEDGYRIANLARIAVSVVQT